MSFVTSQNIYKQISFDNSAGIYGSFKKTLEVAKNFSIFYLWYFKYIRELELYLFQILEYKNQECLYHVVFATSFFLFFWKLTEAVVFATSFKFEHFNQFFFFFKNKHFLNPMTPSGEFDFFRIVCPFTGGLSAEIELMKKRKITISSYLQVLYLVFLLFR